MNNITTLFFATLRDCTRVRSVEMQIPEHATVADFKLILIEKIPALYRLLPHTLVAINQEYVSDETVIPHGAEIALFPPVSGG